MPLRDAPRSSRAERRARLMHLLVTHSGTIDDGAEPRDLGQTPGDIVVLSSADTELSLLARAHAVLAAASPQPSLRLVNLMQLKHNFSVDLYAEKTLAGARLVVLRLLGGRSYWPYGLERLTEMAAAGRFELAVMPGDDKPDPMLAGLSTVSDTICDQLWGYLREGGAENASLFLASLAALLRQGGLPPPPRPLLKAGLYWPGAAQPSLADISRHWREGDPVAAMVFYRALLQSGDLAAIDALLEALAERRLNPLPVYVTSLREEVCLETLRVLFRQAPPGIILNSTAFAASVGAAGSQLRPPFAGLDAMVLQLVFSGESEERWAGGTRGLSPHYIAMHVALPEVDGRVLTRAVSFKTDSEFDAATQHYLTRSVPKRDRVAFVARLAAAWTRLRRTPAPARKLGLILANYPNRDSRLANGVGLDTPQSAVEILHALDGAGYVVGPVPDNGNALIAALKQGPTNAGAGGRRITERLRLEDYLTSFGALPQVIRDAVTARWGAPEADPLCIGGAFAIPALCLGRVAVGIQPARGYHLDPKGTYHDPDLVPPHGYFAFYIWLREVAGVHAVIHLGKHGNLEWLPGKALALSEACYPEAALGPMPNIYPFIVNDPGEGSQAKRRTSAVIIDHLTPPMTRAETYGPLKELEALADEYYEAAGVDEARRRHLAGEILATTARLGLDKDIGIDAAAPQAEALAALDNHLCELKEMQIRDGLHIFGRSPSGLPRTDLLVALARVPRGAGEGGDASLIAALAADFGMQGFEPLSCALGEPWTGVRPARLVAIHGEAWRTNGDTVERLEMFAQALVAGDAATPPGFVRSMAVLGEIRARLAPNVDASGAAELSGLLTALDGRFVAPGPSGAPTRGRPDVLPTGRNFYSLDSRTVPTQAAWELGRKSAELVVARYVQDHGDWPRSLAMSAWGTANMRTGGDDVAQALALMGARPRWEPASRRVTGFEVIPLAKLGRPRVDVTFRVSGFFRDAFPAQIDLLDSAVRALAGLDEPHDENPIAANAARDAARLIAEGTAPEAARRIASARIFGSKPGAYGAGLQTLIDEGLWDRQADFAESYLQWGHYAYGAALEGRPERGALERRLVATDAVLHNQDNREHDILDSDDYYQFEGGLAASVKALKGSAVRVYHNDHSRPERPVVRALEEEIGRVVRGRAANPKWIAGVMRHGYKGAFEIAATVDYLFAFAATTGAVGDHHFEALYEAYLTDDAARAFLAENNADALRDIAARFQEAIDRGLWSPKSNSAQALLGGLMAPARETET